MKPLVSDEEIERLWWKSDSRGFAAELIILVRKRLAERLREEAGDNRVLCERYDALLDAARIIEGSDGD